MSGGPYGRGKAPERACMKRCNWPQSDQLLWSAALALGDPFSEHGGTRATHRPLSNRNVERGYGRWLTFLGQAGALDYERKPADRITAERVRNYVHELDNLGNKRNTILARLEELAEMAKVLAPGHDWRFIARLVSRVRARPESPTTKHARLVGTHELVSLGVQLMESAFGQPKPLRAATLFRDGLIIAFLALIPLRRANLAGLTLGRDLRRSGSGFTIILEPSATKTHATLEYDWPEQLQAALETYLLTHRPVLVSRHGRWHKEAGQRLWITGDGSPLTETGMYDRIIGRTKAAFGKSINPHLFRDAAATTTAIHDPGHVRLAAPLLGHRSSATTERYYQQAQSLEAHREFVDKITRLRQQLLCKKEPKS